MIDVLVEERAPEVHFELSPKDIENAAGLKVGDAISVTIQGKVSSVGQRADWDDKSKIVGHLAVTYDALKVVTKANEFTALAEEED
jgi:hypothetical protein